VAGAGQLRFEVCPPAVYRFGAFEFAPHTRELRKHGIRIHLVSQGCQVLALALERPGECVTRKELENALWPGEEWGDLECRLNKAVSRVRTALGDSSETPRYLETLHGVGYRFLLPVQKVELPPARLLQAAATDPAPPDPTLLPEPGAAPRSAGRWWIWASAIGVLLTGLAVALVALYHRDPRTLDPEPLTGHAGIEANPSFSPGGEELAFSWNGPGEDNFDIYTLTLRDGRLKRLTDTPARDFSPAWSPDGQQIAFLRQTAAARADLMCMRASGGDARRLTQVASPVRPVPVIDWTRDSKSVIFADASDGLQSSLFTISLSDGRRRRISWPPAGTRGDFSPAVSRSGASMAFTRFVDSESNDIFLQPMSASPSPGDAPLRLTDLRMRVERLAWTLGDREIVFAGRANQGKTLLYRIRPSARSQAAADLSDVRIEGDEPAYSNRTLVYVQRSQKSSIWQIDVDSGSGQPVLQSAHRVVASSGLNEQADLSPDGTSIIFASNRLTRQSLWLARADGSDARDLVSAAKAPRWSPDGRSIAFECRDGGQSNICLSDLDRFASGTTRKLTRDAGDNTSPSWSRDGRFVYYRSTRSGSPQIWKVPREGGNSTRITQNGGFFAIESADGKDLYYTVSGISSVLRKQSLETGAVRDVISNVITLPGFDVTSSGIYYLSSGGREGLYFYDFALRSGRRLISFDKALQNGFAVSRDSRRILFTQRETNESKLMVLRSLP
jgi:Tol biopolymer transport system component/DNA-binding winged helix-turn-helix (wHTH) protein